MGASVPREPRRCAVAAVNLPKLWCGIGTWCAKPRAKQPNKYTSFCTIQCGWHMCSGGVPHRILLELSNSWTCLVCGFQDAKPKMLKIWWVSGKTMLWHMIIKNWSPSQLQPPVERPWHKLTEVSCKLYVRANKNCDATPLSTCIRGLTGQSIPKSKWQKMLFWKPSDKVVKQWHHNRGCVASATMPNLWCPTRQFLVSLTPN